MADENYQRDVTLLGDIIATVPVTDDVGNDYDTARRVLRSGWLAQHDAEVARRAAERGWDEGCDARGLAAVNFTPLSPNPYRAEATDTETER